VAWDDDRELEIRGGALLGDRGYVWEARSHSRRARSFRVVLVARVGWPR